MPLRAKFTDLVVQKRLLSRWLHEYISFFNATKTALLLAMNSTASSCLIRDGSMTEMNSKISPVYQIVQRLESNFGVSLGKPPHERKSFVGIHRFRILVISVLAALRFGRICSLQLSGKTFVYHLYLHLFNIVHDFWLFVSSNKKFSFSFLFFA